MDMANFAAQTRLQVGQYPSLLENYQTKSQFYERSELHEH